MRLLVDAQLPPALARWFVSKGHDAIHVFDIEFHRSSDQEIWKFALDNDLILVTKDEDFSSRVWIDLAVVSLRSTESPHMPGFEAVISSSRD